jgi:hypothetical protein
MAKSLSLLLIVFSAIVIAGIYGVVHDQVTYTISNEYYTKFKFIQFELVEEVPEAKLDSPRLGVAVVGFLATFWVGFWVGLILGVIGLMQSTWRKMLTVTFYALSIVFVIAVAVGIIGCIYGWYILGNRERSQFPDWFIPDNLQDFRGFITVGSIHNFSYLGGAIGTVIAAIYSVRSYLINRRDLERLRS